MKSIKKTYEAPTTQSWAMGLTLRGKAVNIKFEDGTDKPNVVKCKFTTSDADLQVAIEATKQFIIGALKCVKTVGEVVSKGITDVSKDLEKPVVIKPEIVVEPTVKEVEPEAHILKYKGIQQVASWLESYRGIDIKLLNTPEAIKKIAEAQNVHLPNIK